MSVFDKGFFNRKKDVGRISFDVNTTYKTFRERFAAANSVVRTSAYGRGGLISVEQSLEDPQKVEFVVKASGRRLSTLEDAHNEISRLSLSEYRVFGGQRGTVSEARSARRLTDPYRSAESLLEDMRKSLGGLDPDKLERLRRAGIDISADNISGIRMTLSSLAPGNKKDIATKIATARNRNEMLGIEMLNDDGGRILSFEVGGKSLTGYQSNLLLAMTNNSRIDSVQLASALQAGSSAKLASVIEKMPKRERSFFSPRDVSLQGNELQNVIDRFVGVSGKKLEDITLIVDPEYDLLRKFADNSYDFGGNKALKQYYRAIAGTGPGSIGIDKYFEPMFEGFNSKLTDVEMGELKKAINSFGAKNNNTWLSDQLQAHLETAFVAGDERRGSVVASIFKTIEQGWDGADVVNSKFLHAIIKELESSKSLLEGQLATTSDRAAQSEIKVALVELESRIRQVKSGDLSQITGRGRLRIAQLGNQFRNIKTAFNIEKKLQGKGALENVGMIISKHGLKGESGIAGELSSLLLSGIGSSGDIVYADPVATAMHSEIFTSKEAFEAMKRNRDSILKEYRATVDSGIIPEKVKRTLLRQSQVNIDLLPGDKKLSGLRNKEFAEDMLRAIESGASTKDSPYLASMVHRFYATQAFRTKYAADDMVLQPALANTHRFAINTERIRLGTSSVNESIYKFGTTADAPYGFEKISLKGENNSAVHSMVGKLRIEGHTLFFADHAASIFHHSLGGFDLDDKGLVRLVTYEDAKGGKRLGTYVFRQPSGPEEIIFKRINMDQETIRALFGHEEFQNTLQTMLTENLDNQNPPGEYIGLRRLTEFFDEESPLYKSTGMVDRPEEVEQSIIRVRERMVQMGLTEDLRLDQKTAKRIGQFGGSSLQLRDIMLWKNGEKATHLTPAYSRQGLYNVMFGEGVFDMSKEVAATLDESGIDSKIIEKIRASSGDFNEMMRIIGSELPSEEASALIAESVGKMSLSKAMQDGDILGTYINRSMVVGSTLNQYEAFLENAPANVRSFLTNEKNIAFRMGVAPPESVIDPIVNLGGAKKFHSATQAIIQEYGATMSPDKLSGVLQKFISPESIGKPITVEEIGTGMIESLGRVIGMARAVGSTDPDLMMGIDLPTLVERLNKKDRMNLITQMKYGAEVARGQGFVASDRVDEVLSQISSYSEFIDAPDDKKVIEFLKKNIGLNSEHRFAAEAKMRAYALDSNLLFDVVRRDSIRKVSIDPLLAMAKFSTAEESVVEEVLKRHKDSLEAIFGVTDKQMKDRGALEYDQWRMLKDKVGNDIFEDLHRAGQIKGVTKSGMLDAVDQALMINGIDLASLHPIMDEFGDPVNPSAYQGYKNLTDNRVVRRLAHYKKLNQANAENVMEMMFKPGDEVTADAITRRAAEILDGSDEVSALQKNVLSSLAGRRDQIDSEIARKQADIEAEVVRARYESDRLTKEGFLNADGTTDALMREGHIDDIAGHVDDADFDSGLLKARNKAFEDFEDLSASRGSATYKRIADKFKGKEFEEILGNPLVRKGALAAGALIVGSFAYSAYKGRSKDDIAGPPMLPGGSAYEDSVPSRSSQVPFVSGQGYQSGTSYQVSIYGGRNNVAKFNSAAGNLVNGNINTTMYNRIPDVGRDPYSSLASSY